MLHDGIPAWIAPSVAHWLHAVLAASRDEYSAIRIIDLTRRVQLKLKSKIILDWRNGEQAAAESLVTAALDDPEVGLDVIDCILHLGGRRLLSPAYDGGAMWLHHALTEGGSVWTVGEVGDDDDYELCLQRRVDDTVAKAATAAMETKTSAAGHLRGAWQAIYGRHPNSSEGYHEAVRAVEAAAKQTVTPADSVATLGKMISAMRDAPGKWSMRFTEPGVDPISVVIETMKLLWRSQYDRHGQPGEGPPRRVAQKEAEDAVHLAVLLVHWFQNGAITLR